MEKILVVEDETHLRESLEEIFNLAGYSVNTASNGKEGFDLILEDKPDLVVCDVSMPELDGFELLGAINNRLREEVIPPFLFLTAKVESQDIRQGMSLGADDYILKPFDHSSLLEVVRLRLDKRKKLLNKAGILNQPKSTGIKKLALPNEEGLILVSFDDIIKCEADRSYCNFYLNGGDKILVSKSMKEFEEALLKNGFVKVHSSNIVNINFAEKYLKGTGGQLLMADGSIVPVAVRKKGELIKLLKG